MNNWLIVVLMGAYTSLINEVSLSLGLTARWIPEPEALGQINEGGFLDGLISLGRWAVNSLGSFVQLITFSADIPTIINTLIVAPLGLGMFYLAYVMVRGGAG